MVFHGQQQGASDGNGSAAQAHYDGEEDDAAAGRAKSVTRAQFLAGAGYGVALAGFTVWTLLDTFTIARAQADATSINTAMLEQYAASSSSATDSTETALASDAAASATQETSEATATQAASTEAAATDQGATEQASVTDTSYTDSNIAISITTGTTSNTTYYVADVQVSSVEYLKTALAQGTYGRNIKQTTSSMAEENGAILAINGDYYGFRDDGYVIRNGVLYRDTPSSGTDALVVSSDGSMYAASEDVYGAQELLDNGAWQVLSFGPVLVDGGAIAVNQNTEVEQSKTSNPRTSVGMIDPLHYLFIVSDGRTSASAGLTLYELAQIYVDNGASFAYNLDGGGSTTMWFNGSVINVPTDGNSMGERKVSDIVYIG